MNSQVAEGHDKPRWLGFVVALLAGGLAVISQDLWGGIIVLGGLIAFSVGSLRPQLLIPVVASAIVLLPPFVGWITPTGFYLNLTRAVIYAASAGLLIWALQQSKETSAISHPVDQLDPYLRLGIVALGAGWFLAVLLGFTHGAANGVRVMNLVLYAALPLWLGMRFARDYPGVRVLQLTFLLLLIYSSAFCLYELITGRNALAEYVPPLSGLLSADHAMIREGHVRAEAMFGQPLAFDQFLLLALPISGSLALTPALRMFGVIGITLGGISLLATGSRSPWVAILIGVLVVLGIRRPRIVFVGLALAGVVVLLNSSIRDRAFDIPRQFVQTVSTKAYSSESEMEFSAASRMVLAVAGARAIARRPVTGYGVHSSASGANLPTVDNYFLLLPIEIGLPAAFMILGAIVWLWFRLAVERSMPLELSVIFASLAMYLVELLFVGLVDTLPLFFLVLGVVIGSVGFRPTTFLQPARGERSRTTAALDWP